MHAFTIVSATAILASQLVAGAALPVEQVEARGLQAKMPPSNSASLDVPECLWKSEEGFYVTFATLIPNGNADALKSALKSKGGCAGYSQFQSEMVGAKSGTLFAGFWASDFCTAYDVTQIIKKATGATINCDKYAEAEAGGPGPDSLIAEMWEDGDDGEDVSIKREANQPTSLSELHDIFSSQLDRTKDLPVIPTKVPVASH